MSEKQKDYTPHFHEAVTDITDENGQLLMSLLHVPSTSEHYRDYISETGRSDANILDIEKFRQDYAKEIERIDKEYEDQKVFESDKGEIVSARVVNRADDKPTVIMFSPYTTDSTWENTQAMVEASALLLPGYQVVYIDTPGMGESTKVAEEDLKAMKDTGSYMPMAQQIASCLKGADFKVAAIFGRSEGGREATALGAVLGDVNVITIDDPGASRMFFGRLAKGFMRTEAKRQKEVMANTPDKVMVEAQKRDQAKVASQVGRTLLRKTGLMGRELAMSREGLEDDVIAATDAGCHVVSFRAEASGVSDTDKVKVMSKKIKGYKTLVMPKSPHTIVDTNPYAEAMLLASGLDYLNPEK